MESFNNKPAKESKNSTYDKLGQEIIGQEVSLVNTISFILSALRAQMWENMGRKDLLEPKKPLKSLEELKNDVVVEFVLTPEQIKQNFVADFYRQEKERLEKDTAANNQLVEYLEKQNQLGLNLKPFESNSEKEALIQKFLDHQRELSKENRYCIPDSDLKNSDVNLVGGKSASLGEMVGLTEYNINVPRSYATTAKLYHDLLAIAGLDQFIEKMFTSRPELNMNDIDSISIEIKGKIENLTIPEQIEDILVGGYYKLCKNANNDNLSVAVRSSATTEDLEGASSAGQQATLLNVVGVENIKKSFLECVASLYTERAIAYRQEKNQPQFGPALALGVAVQQMARADIGVAGVGFSANPENLDKNQIIITSGYGIGEEVVQGNITPDQYELIPTTNTLREKKLVISKKFIGSKSHQMIFNLERDGANDKHFVKTIPVSIERQQSHSLVSEVVLELGRIAKDLEKHYSEINSKFTPMDFEFVVTQVFNQSSGQNIVTTATGELYLVEIVQARPITTGENEYSLRQNNQMLYTEFNLIDSPKTKPDTGITVQKGIVSGKPVFLKDVEKPTIADLERIFAIAEVSNNEVVIFVRKTDPDTIPLLQALIKNGIKICIVSDTGGKTSHAAIVAREFGIPTIVNCKTADKMIKTTDTITVVAVDEDIDGVYFEKLNYSENQLTLDLPIEKTVTQLKLICGNPDLTYTQDYNIPFNDGSGLFRLEFLAAKFGIHPEALENFDNLDEYTQLLILQQIPLKYRDSVQKMLQYEIDFMTNGLREVCLNFKDKIVTFRGPDFKSNEYKNLIGGEHFEPDEENPMLGWRGVSRYKDRPEQFKRSLQPFVNLFNEGIRNFDIMIPFVRTVQEAWDVLKLISEAGIKKGMYNKLLMMCEIPTNVEQVEEFLSISYKDLEFDGFSIGSNDLTQLMLGLDRDASTASLTEIGNPTYPAVLNAIVNTIKRVKAIGKTVGICGNAPYDYPEIVEPLIKAGIDSISISPDPRKAIDTYNRILEVEKAMAAGKAV